MCRFCKVISFKTNWVNSSAIAKLYGKVMFNFVKELPVFQSGSTVLYSYQQ